MYTVRYRQIEFTPIFDVNGERIGGRSDAEQSAPVANVLWYVHAGGSTGALAARARGWQSKRASAGLPPIRLHSPIPPLREEAHQETFDGELTDLAAEYVEAAKNIPGLRDLPLIVIGHSYGSIVAYEVTRRLLGSGFSPHRFMALSFPAPDRMTHELKLHTLDDESLVREVDELFGGIPKDLQSNPEALSFFVPGLRSDLGLLERYQQDADSQPIATAMTVMVGTDDHAVDLADAQRWSSFCEHEIRVQTLPGDHFFPLSRLPEVLEAAVWDLTSSSK